MKNLALKNYKTFKGHDGMRGINADIHYNGKKIATVYDDAMGGEFDYNIIGKYDSNGYAENKKSFNNLLEEIKKLPPISFMGSSLPQDLDMVITDLCSILDQKKDEKKGVLTKCNGGYEIVGFKVSIPTAIKKYGNGLTEIQKVYDKAVEEGKEVLNKEYLKSQGIKI